MDQYDFSYNLNFPALTSFLRRKARLNSNCLKHLADTLKAKDTFEFQGMTKEQVEAVDRGQTCYEDLTKGVEVNVEAFKGFYDVMAQMVVHERNRLGGDFAIAQAVPTRELRDYIKKICGPDLIFIVLVLPKETVVERLGKRHGTGDVADAITDMCVKLNDAYENTGEDELNSFDVVIDGKMTPDDVAKKILDVVNKV